MTETCPIRVTKKRYKELRRIAKANGHTISWLANYALDLYFQSLEPQVNSGDSASVKVNNGQEQPA